MRRNRIDCRRNAGGLLVGPYMSWSDSIGPDKSILPLSVFSRPE